MSRNKTALLTLSIVCFLIIVFNLSSEKTADLRLSSTSANKWVSSHDSQQKSSNKMTQISVGMSVSEQEFTGVKQLSKQVEDANPDIHIKLINYPQSEAFSLIQKTLQLGNPPDVLLLDNTWINQFASSGYLQNMDDYFTNEEVNQQLNAVMSQVKWNGYIWAIPKDVNPYIVVYNKNIVLDTLSPVTGDHLLADNQNLLKNKSSNGVYINTEDPFAFISLVWSLGGEWTQGKPVPYLIKSKFDTQRLASFFGFRKDSSKLEKTIWNDDPWKQLQEGKIPMMIAAFSDYWAHDDQDLGFMPMLDSKTNSGGWLLGRSYVVTSRSKHAQEALQWINEMKSADYLAKMWTQFGSIPALQAQYQAAITGNYSHSEMLMKTVEDGRVFMPESDMHARMQVFSDYLNQLTGELNSSNSMKDFNRVISPFINTDPK